MGISSLFLSFNDVLIDTDYIPLVYFKLHLIFINIFHFFNPVLFYQRLLLSILLSIGFTLRTVTYIRDELEQYLDKYCLRTKRIVTYLDTTVILSLSS